MRLLDQSRNPDTFVIDSAGIKQRLESRHQSSVLARLYRAALRVRFKFRLRGYDTLRVETAGTVRVIILPGVFNGVLLRTGVFLATTLDANSIPRGARVLDLGTGSGINAIFAARLGGKVVATDINPEAARCAHINALAHHLESQLETRVGDLFEPVPGERFDVILFNPPYYRGGPRDLADCAWRSPDAFDRFLRELPSHFNARRTRVVRPVDRRRYSKRAVDRKRVDSPDGPGARFRQRDLDGVRNYDDVERVDSTIADGLGTLHNCQLRLRTECHFDLRIQPGGIFENRGCHCERFPRRNLNDSASAEIASGRNRPRNDNVLSIRFREPRGLSGSEGKSASLEARFSPDGTAQGMGHSPANRAVRNHTRKMSC